METGPFGSLSEKLAQLAIGGYESLATRTTPPQPRTGRLFETPAFGCRDYSGGRKLNRYHTPFDWCAFGLLLSAKTFNTESSSFKTAKNL